MNDDGMNISAFEMGVMVAAIWFVAGIVLARLRTAWHARGRK